MADEKIRVVIVSGLSGAGKTVALRALEDVSYFCTDNLPANLIGPFLATISANEPVHRVGIGVDIREKAFLAGIYTILSSLRQQYSVEVLFLEAETEVMVRRYKETRRPHPMVPFRGKGNLEDAIAKERAILASVRDAADRIIDTSTFSPHQLRHLIHSIYDSAKMQDGLAVTLLSFGFKFGVPQNVDLLFDARFLPNPYFVPELKVLKGTDPEVSAFVLGSEETGSFLGHLFSLLDYLIPRYLKEGRAYLVIGVGCTGGRHRSPVIVEEFSRHFLETQGIEVAIVHRDIDL